MSCSELTARLAVAWKIINEKTRLKAMRRNAVRWKAVRRKFDEAMAKTSPHSDAPFRRQGCSPDRTLPTPARIDGIATDDVKIPTLPGTGFNLSPGPPARESGAGSR